MTHRWISDGDYVRRNIKIQSLETVGCWPWEGPRSKSGSAIANRNGYHYSAPRFVYELLVGPIPEDLKLLPKCGNARCVNPSHREFITAYEAMRRGTSVCAANARKTHCRYGHPYIVEKCTGKRICPVCRKINRELGR